MPTQKKATERYLILTDIETLREVATNTVEVVAEEGTRLTPEQAGPEALLFPRCMSVRQLLVLFEPQISSCMFLIYFKPFCAAKTWKPSWAFRLI